MADAYPSMPWNGFPAIAHPGTASLATLDATNDGTGTVFYSITSDPITHVFVRYGVRTGTPPSYIVALEGVTSSGNPDGTIKGGGTPASKVFTPPADASWNTTGQWIALDNPYTPAMGELLSLTVRHSSGTVDASNFSTFGRTLSALTLMQVPYTILLTAGTWAKSQSLPIYGYKTASKVFGWPAVNGYLTTTATLGNRQCLKFTPPTSWGTQAQAIGIAAAFSRIGSSGGSYKIGVWNAAGTELASTGSILSNVLASVTNGGSAFFSLSTPLTLTFGQPYYIGFENTSASNTTGIAGYIFADPNDRAVLPNGTAKCLSTWNGTAWTDDTTVIPVVDLIVNTIDFPAGGGGDYTYAQVKQMKYKSRSGVMI